MTHTCRACEEEFETLSSYRLHDCDGDKWKEADRVEFETFGYHKDGTPVVVFRVEMEHGSDTFGKFKLAFASLRDPETGEPKFAFIDGQEQPIVTKEYTEEVEEFLTAVQEQDSYITAINYKNTDYHDEYGNVGMPILGRHLGKVYDWVERVEPLPPGMDDTLTELKDILENDTGQVTLQEADFPGPLRPQEPGHVLEIAMGTNNPTATPSVIAYERGRFKFNEGIFTTVLLIEDMPCYSKDPIEVVPLTNESRAKEYLRFTFKDPKMAQSIFIDTTTPEQ